MGTVSDAGSAKMSTERPQKSCHVCACVHVCAMGCTCTRPAAGALKPAFLQACVGELAPWPPHLLALCCGYVGVEGGHDLTPLHDTPAGRRAGELSQPVRTAAITHRSVGLGVRGEAVCADMRWPCAFNKHSKQGWVLSLSSMLALLRPHSPCMQGVQSQPSPAAAGQRWQLTLVLALNAERGADWGVTGEPATRAAADLPWGVTARGMPAAVNLTTTPTTAAGASRADDNQPEVVWWSACTPLPWRQPSTQEQPVASTLLTLLHLQAPTCQPGSLLRLALPGSPCCPPAAGWPQSAPPGCC